MSPAIKSKGLRTFVPCEGGGNPSAGYLSQSGRHSKLRYQIVPRSMQGWHLYPSVFAPGRLCRPVAAARIIRCPSGHSTLGYFSKNISST